MRFAGIDFGERRIGVSISDELLICANALEVIERREGAIKEPIKRISGIAEEYGVTRFIVGLPKNMDNSCGKMAEEAERFAKRLEKELKIPAVLWDERLTSRSAERVLLENDFSRKKRKTKIDAVAAAIILQNYLDYFERAQKAAAQPTQ